MPNAWRIAEQMGIRMHGRRDRHPGSDVLPARHTWARKAVFDIAKAGEGADLPEHVYDVLGLFLASEANQRQLFGESIRGVSAWALKHRVTSAEVPFLAPAFGEVDMKLVRQAVRHMGLRQHAPQIAFLVSSQMEDALEAIRS